MYPCKSCQYKAACALGDSENVITLEGSIVDRLGAILLLMGYNLFHPTPGHFSETELTLMKRIKRCFGPREWIIRRLMRKNGHDGDNHKGDDSQGST